MSTVRGEAGFGDLLDAGGGFVTEPAAVFGLGGDMLADPPGWLAEPTEVRRRLAAKPVDDGVDAVHWPGVVELALRCAEVADDVTDEGAAPAQTVHRALTLSTALARRLPKPPIALLDVAAFPAPAADLIERALAQGVAAGTGLDTGLDTELDGDAAGYSAGEMDAELAVARRLGAAGLGPAPAYLLGYWQDRLREHSCRLADCIEDPLWTDPDALAGLVDDARRLLAAYFATVLELEPWPMPRPRRPAAGGRRPTRRPMRRGSTGPGLGRHVSQRPPG